MPDAALRPCQRRGVLRGLGAGLAAAVLPAGALHAAEPLVVTLLPYLSPRAMLGQFDPLRRHLATSLGRPVEFYTTSNFGALLDGVRERTQPLTMMPLHLARIAVADWGHTLVARAARETPVQLLVPGSAGVLEPAALRGRRIGAIDPLAVTALVLRRWLRQQRLEGEVQVQHLPSLNALVLALARGEVDAIVVAQSQVLDIAWPTGEPPVAMAELATVYTACFVALKDTPETEVAACRAALLRFQPPGRRAAAGAAGVQYVEGLARDLEPYEPYAAEVRRMLAEAAAARAPR